MKALNPNLEGKPFGGRVPAISKTESDIIILSEDIVLSSQDLNDLIKFAYPDLSMYSDPKYFVERRILAPTNEYVNSIKTIIMNQFPAGEAFEYLSADTLILKLGTPIILLCNLQPNDGLCNWTRLVCRTFQNHDIETEIITGNHPGNQSFHSSHYDVPSETELPFISNVIAFAMTINKSYG
ncbi:unnamed protein product [Rhizophagus irregularis]|nr:unnamed protein product [Rhizophagus irregularis]CAB5204550.1 unnamed protein product [Rhizophagus irregularis]